MLQHIKVRPNWVTALAAGIIAGSSITTAIVFLAGVK